MPTVRALAVAVAALTVLTACSAADAEPGPQARSGDWSAVLEQARGQDVRWYMYGGDDTLNDFVTGYLADRLEEHGVGIDQVRVTDTVDAVNKVLAEKQAGRDRDGSVDLIWVNGENFATGRQAGLWHCGYDRDLPNATYVDFEDPAVTHDFGVPVEGCESVWQHADSALVYDSAALTRADVESVSSLFAWAERNPGRFTHAAPPDFTGSMAVRTFLYDTVGGPDSSEGSAFEGTEVDESGYGPASARLWRRLNDLGPSLWRGGRTYPTSQSDVERLYGNGEIDAYLTYGPGGVADLVEKGVFPDSTRQAVLGVGNIANNSFVAIPYNARHTAAAQVLANELLDPAVQLELFRAAGVYPAIDLDRLSDRERTAFDAVDLGPSVLPLAELTANTRPELAAAYVTRIEADWTRRVLQR